MNPIGSRIAVPGIAAVSILLLLAFGEVTRAQTPISPVGPAQSQRFFSRILTLQALFARAATGCSSGQTVVMLAPKSSHFGRTFGKRFNRTFPSTPAEAYAYAIVERCSSRSVVVEPLNDDF
ncbi:MAG: hypothetical protein M3126_12700 [Candidatus Eremiobacteraeota bacterium]|nr:hypothetical protein [Candidatus Eremiobacteraeota bacterium]